jgi:hypothetical protein
VEIYERSSKQCSDTFILALKHTKRLKNSSFRVASIFHNIIQTFLCRQKVLFHWYISLMYYYWQEFSLQMLYCIFKLIHQNNAIFSFIISCIISFVILFLSDLNLIYLIAILLFIIGRMWERKIVFLIIKMLL